MKVARISKPTRLLLLLIIGCVVTLFFLVYVHRDDRARHFAVVSNRIRQHSSGIKSKIMVDCEQLLTDWNTEIPILLVDSNFLNDLNKPGCRWDTAKPIKIGVDEKYKTNVSILNDHRFEVAYYVNDDSNDFLDFHVNERKIIPRKFETRRTGNFEVPTDSEKFNGFWNSPNLKSNSKSMIKCDLLLKKWNTDIPVLLIDSKLLNDLSKPDCLWNAAKSIKIGVNADYKLDKSLLDDDRFKLIYYLNDADKDFLDFDVDGRRIIPKRFETKWIGNFEVSTNIEQFLEFWKRSKFVDCVGLKVKRDETEEAYMPIQPALDLLALLRDELIDNDMYSFLNGGTLLGWYRECALIPHTYDMDLAVYHNNYNPEYLKKLERSETDFKIVRRLGRATDSLEMTVVPNEEVEPKIDIFLMYDGIENGEITHSYVSGLDVDGTKYKWSYPVYDPWCAAELHNHLFWVSCTPKQKIVIEYGQYWYLDKPTATYSWNSGHENVKENGKFTEEELNKIYIVY